MKSVEKKHRRFLAAILALCLLLGLCPLTPSAQAEETTATVAGSTTRENAQSVPIGVPVTSALNAGVNYYAIPDVKASQQISVELDKRYDGVYTSLCKPNGGVMNYGYVADVNGTHFLAINAKTPTTVTFTVTLYDNDAHEPNDTLKTATPIEPGKTVDGVLFSEDADYFAFTTAKPYQYVVVDAQYTGALDGASLYDAAGALLAGRTLDGKSQIFCAGEAGTHYLKFYAYPGGRASYSFTVTLCDNDANELNNTKEQATTLHSGESTEFTLAGSDVDYFKVTTTAPGKDIALTVSGYNYANRGEKFSLYFDPAGDLQDINPSCAAYAEIKANGTLYLHAAAAGEHNIALKRLNRVNGSDPNPLCLTRTLSVEILDGDQNEPNDTRGKATRLTLGTDETFMVGGFGDEDWFSFEAVPGAAGKTLYTLNFLDLNTDYSDEFFYEVYAPDGTPVVRSTRVNIRHVNTIGCDQQGQYLVRVYTTAAKGTNYFASVDGSYNGRAMDYKRSALRICVSEGGDDPYESNDTWLTAANVPVGNIQHVLASAVDTDWFCFTVPEDDMTLHLTSTKKTGAALYRAEDLMEKGDGATALLKRDTDFYYKLTDAGVYYIRLRADSSYISTDIRTTGIELLPATDEENNDTWKKATPLYEGVPQSFTLSADNDVDWFKIVVPENGSRVNIRTKGNSISYSLYREQDFLTAGDNAGEIQSWGSSTDDLYLSLDAGIYYLKADAFERRENCSVIYNVRLTDTNNSFETAKLLAPGEWAEYHGEYYFNGPADYRYFCIGERKVGEVVRVSRDAAGNLYRGCALLNAEGEKVSRSGSANCTFRISETGIYYLCVETQKAQDDNGKWRLNRLCYDVGSGEKQVSAIESVDSLTLIEGETMFLDLRCAPYDAVSESGITFDYNWDNYTCANWNCDSGYLTARSAGTDTLSVSLHGNSDVKKEIPVTVLAKDSLSASDVSISDAPETLSLGASADLTANYTLAGGAVLTNPQKAVTWTSSDPKVLYVSPGGKITAVGGGTATITATVGGVSATTADITVTAEEQPTDTVTSLTLDKYSLTLYMNEEGEQLTATVQPASFAGKVVWESSETKVASVSSDGLVTAVGPGTCIISATVGDRHVSATVSVLAARVRVSGVSFAETKHEIPMGGTATLTATITPADATVKTLVWTSDDPGIASVSRTGIVTALHVGTTTIRATSVDGNHSAEITVTVTAAPQLGDVNGDGYIDSADAMLCLRSAVGLTELTAEQKSAADVNKDGFVDAGDAIKILRYDAKLIGSLK